MSDLIVIGYPDEETAHAENLDIKDDFKQRVQDMLQPGTSAILVIPRRGAAAHEDPARGGPEGAHLGAANGLSRGAGLGDLIATLAPRAVTLAGRVMWLRTASSSLVTKRTSERERWTDEDRR
jgi:hypothetical protein